MSRIISILLIFILITFSNFTWAQNSDSFEVSGGVLFPSGSPVGINSSIQFNYAFNKNMQFYIYSGYSYWDKYNVNFTESLSTIQQITNFRTYLSDHHILFPVYLGAKLNFAKNKIFSAYTLFEAGYSHLSYNSYFVKKKVDPQTGQVLYYYTDKSTKRKVNANLFGFGVGIELMHEFTKNLGVMLSFKLNSQLNSGTFKIINGEGTYTSLNLGINVKI